MLDGMGAQPTDPLTPAHGHRSGGERFGHRSQARVRQKSRGDSLNSKPSWGYCITVQRAAEDEQVCQTPLAEMKLGKRRFKRCSKHALNKYRKKRKKERKETLVNPAVTLEFGRKMSHIIYKKKKKMKRRRRRERNFSEFFQINCHNPKLHDYASKV